MAGAHFFLLNSRRGGGEAFDTNWMSIFLPHRRDEVRISWRLEGGQESGGRAPRRLPIAAEWSDLRFAHDLRGARWSSPTPRLRQVSVAPLFAEAIRSIYEETSISRLSD